MKHKTKMIKRFSEEGIIKGKAVKVVTTSIFGIKIFEDIIKTTDSNTIQRLTIKKRINNIVGFKNN